MFRFNTFTSSDSIFYFIPKSFSLNGIFKFKFFLKISESTLNYIFNHTQTKKLARGKNNNIVSQVIDQLFSLINLIVISCKWKINILLDLFS